LKDYGNIANPESGVRSERGLFGLAESGQKLSFRFRNRDPTFWYY